MGTGAGADLWGRSRPPPRGSAPDPAGRSRQPRHGTVLNPAGRWRQPRRGTVLRAGAVAVLLLAATLLSVERPAVPVGATGTPHPDNAPSTAGSPTAPLSPGPGATAGAAGDDQPGGPPPATSPRPGLPPRPSTSAQPDLSPRADPSAWPEPSAWPDPSAWPGPALDSSRLPVPTGKVGVPVSLSDPAALAVVRLGDRVDLLTVPHDGEPATLVADVTVLGLDRPELTLLLALTPAQAQQVLAARERFAVVVRP